jgi:DNA-binding MarR family transcriptional regulator
MMTGSCYVVTMAPGEWPSEAELGGAIWRTQRAIERAVDARLGPLGLSSAVFRLLRQLAHQPGQSAADLARRLGFAPQSIALTVDRAVAQSLVERRAHPWHGRVLELCLTERGMALHAAAMEVIGAVEAELVADLDQAARSRVWRSLRSVADRADAMAAARLTDGSGHHAEESPPGGRDETGDAGGRPRPARGRRQR